MKDVKLWNNGLEDRMYMGAVGRYVVSESQTHAPSTCDR